MSKGTTPTQTLNCSKAVFSQSSSILTPNSSQTIKSIAVDSYLNIYVSDSSAQVWKFTANSNSTTTGELIAPISTRNSLGSGRALSELGHALGLAVDAMGDNVYIADTGPSSWTGAGNQRILRWPISPWMKAGTTVAGAALGSTNGSDNAILTSYGVFLDRFENLFVSDFHYHRVTKWLPNAVSGILVAGTGMPGSNMTQLYGPMGLWVNDNGDVYVADSVNHRVVKWVNSASFGILIGGGLGPGPFAAQLNNPTSLFVDTHNNVFVLDAGNRRIQQFLPGHLVGITVFDGSFNDLIPINAYSMAVDYLGNLYLPDSTNKRVQKVNRISASYCNSMYTRRLSE